MPRSLDDVTLRERRARLRAERLLEQARNDLTRANAQLKAHAHELSHQIIAQRGELQTIRDFASQLQGSNTETAQALEVAHSVADLAVSRLRAAIETLPDGFALFDADQKLVLANQAYLTQFAGFPEVTEGVGYARILEICAYEDVVDLQDQSPEAWVDSMLLRWQATQIAPVELHFTSGVSVRLMDRRAPNGDYVSLGRNITRNLRYQAELIDAQTRAEAAARAKSAFLANMSHEIRTPMNGVIAMADLLNETPLDTEQRLYAETIRNSGQSLVSIINDILDYSKMDADRLELHPEAFDLEQKIHEVLMMVAPLARSKGLELILDCDLFLPKLVRADPQRLRQVLTNLVGNAVKFTDRGYVLVRVVGVGNSTHGQLVHITVEDTGIGIAPENQIHVFSEFHQVDDMANRRFEGTGLGLAISSRIVEMMGGRIWLESELGVGSCFGFSLEFEAPEQPPVAENGSLPSTVRSVVLLSDHLISRSILERQFKAVGVSVTTASHAQPALRQITGTQADIVILDQDLGSQAAHEVVKLIRHACPEIPIVMLCSSLTDCTDLVADGLIREAVPKPVLWRDVIATVRRAMTPAPDGHGLTPSAPQPDPVAAVPADTMPRRVKVLYAEDNATNRLVFSKMLKDLPIDLHMAVNGRDAIEKFGQIKPDIIFMDVSMPEIDGHEATRRIRAQPEGAEVPILALTAHAMPEEAQRLAETGVNMTLTKPIRKAALLEALRLHAPPGSAVASDQDRRRKTGCSAEDDAGSKR